MRQSLTRPQDNQLYLYTDSAQQSNTSITLGHVLETALDVAYKSCMSAVEVKLGAIGVAVAAGTTAVAAYALYQVCAHTQYLVPLKTPSAFCHLIFRHLLCSGLGMQAPAHTAGSMVQQAASASRWGAWGNRQHTTDTHC